MFQDAAADTLIPSLLLAVETGFPELKYSHGEPSSARSLSLSTATPQEPYRSTCLVQTGAPLCGKLLG